MICHCFDGYLYVSNIFDPSARTKFLKIYIDETQLKSKH